MSKLAVHIQHFKKGAVGSLAGHNFYKRGSKDEHSNQDIDPERSHLNIPLIVPEDGLYQTVKDKVAGATGRVTAASIWVTEWIVYPPEDLQDPKTADVDELKRYFGDVQDWMISKGFIPDMSVIHMDETTVHGHIDTVPLTEDGRLSRKDVYTRPQLNSIHTDLAKYLQEKGWDIQRGESTAGKGVQAKTVREYKKYAEATKEQLIQELDKMQEEIEATKTEKEQLQAQLDESQKLLDEVKKSAVHEQARHDELLQLNAAGLEIIEENNALIDEQVAKVEHNEQIIFEQEDAMGLIVSYQEYQEESDAVSQSMDLLEGATKDLHSAIKLFKTDEATAWLQRMAEVLRSLRTMIDRGIQRMRIYEKTYGVEPPLSAPAAKRADSIDEQIAKANNNAKSQYHMDWKIQTMLDEIYGTNFAAQDKKRYFAEQAARERELEFRERRLKEAKQRSKSRGSQIRSKESYIESLEKRLAALPAIATSQEQILERIDLENRLEEAKAQLEVLKKQLEQAQNEAMISQQLLNEIKKPSQTKGR